MIQDSGMREVYDVKKIRVLEIGLRDDLRLSIVITNGFQGESGQA